MAAPAIDGVWFNELGSEMAITVSGNDVAGTYKTAVGSGTIVNQKCDLKGTLHYPLISFIVRFSDTDSLCAWIGRFEETDGALTLKTSWTLSYLYSGEEASKKPVAFWESFMTNQDVFTQTSNI